MRRNQQRPQVLSTGEEAFATHCQCYGLRPVREFRFHPERRWRVDFAFPEQRIAVEIEGAVWRQGRHQTGTGFSRDMEKYNALARAGWRLLRYSTQMVISGAAIDEVREVLG